MSWHFRLKFVVDHIAKPDIRGDEFDEWARGMEALSLHQNVYCKM